MTWSAETSCGFEQDKIRYESAKYTGVGPGLDLGCGAKRIWPRCTGIDAQTSPEGAQIQGDIRTLAMFADGVMPWVFSSHALEDLEDTEGALREWWRVLKHGGYLVLYLPHADHYPNIGQEGANPEHKHDFRPNDIVRVMHIISSGWDLCENEVRTEENEYSFYMVFRKRNDGKIKDLTLGPRPRTKVLVCRYGGFGDVLQASSVLPGLKAQYYHVTMMTTPRGRDILREDPHIDDWWLQDEDQIPNHELHDYWNRVARRFDKFVNLSESVEGTWLAYPGRASYYWPDHVRRKYLGRNYLEFTAELAGVPYRPEIQFYPTADECEWAAAERASIPGAPLVLWCLSGSSIHKAYPWTDAVIAKLMSETRASVVFVGDQLCKLLEAGWENEQRVLRRSGQWPMRKTLSFARICDVVVGPETGILNSVAFNEHIRKVVLLSHSSHENLTRDWANTVALEPEETPCYPCHRMHIGREYCHLDEETHAALCAYNILPARVVEAIVERLPPERQAA